MSPKLPLSEFVREAVIAYFNSKTWVGSPLRHIPRRYQEQIAAAITTAVEQYANQEIEEERREWEETHADAEQMELLLKGVVSHLEGRITFTPEDLYGLDDFHLAIIEDENEPEGSVTLTTVITGERKHG